jgi:hypothetical protein
VTLSELRVDDAAIADLGDAAVPRTIFIVLTMTLERSAAARSLFQPCKFGSEWSTQPRPDKRYDDFDPELAKELRQAGPHFTGEVSSEQLRASSDVVSGLSEVVATWRKTPVLLRLGSAHLGVTDVGYAVLTLEFEVTRGDDEGPQIVDLSLVNSLRSPAVALAMPFLADVSFADGAHPTGATSLWGHVLYDFERADGVDLAILAPDVEQDGSDLLVPLTNGFIKPGLGSSVVAGTGADVVRIAARVLALVSGYYAAAAEFDREIFSHLQARVDRGARLGVYDRLFEEVSLFQAVLSTLDLHLAASTAVEVRVWGRYAKAWRLDRQLEALTQKLNLLRTFQDREIARVSLDRTQHLSVVAAVFTMLGFISTLLALVDFGQGHALSRPNVVRSALSALLIVVVVVTFAMWVKRRATTPQ